MIRRALKRGNSKRGKPLSEEGAFSSRSDEETPTMMLAQVTEEGSTATPPATITETSGTTALWKDVPRTPDTERNDDDDDEEEEQGLELTHETTWATLDDEMDEIQQVIVNDAPSQLKDKVNVKEQRHRSTSPSRRTRSFGMASGAPLPPLHHLRKSRSMKRVSSMASVVSASSVASGFSESTAPTSNKTRGPFGFLRSRSKRNKKNVILEEPVTEETTSQVVASTTTAAHDTEPLRNAPTASQKKPLKEESPSRSKKERINLLHKLRRVGSKEEDEEIISMMVPLEVGGDKANVLRPPSPMSACVSDASSSRKLVDPPTKTRSRSASPSQSMSTADGPRVVDSRPTSPALTKNTNASFCPRTPPTTRKQDPPVSGEYSTNLFEQEEWEEGQEMILTDFRRMSVEAVVENTGKQVKTQETKVSAANEDAPPISHIKEFTEGSIAASSMDLTEDSGFAQLKVPTKRTSSKYSPESLASKRKAAKKAQKEAARKEAEAKRKAEKERIAAKQANERKTAGIAAKKSAARMAAETALAEEAAEEAAVKKATEEAAVKKATEEAAVKKATAEVAKKTAKEAAAKKVAGEAKAAEESSAENSAEKALTIKAAKVVAAKVSPEEAPTQIAKEAASKKNPEEASREAAAKKAAEKKADAAMKRKAAKEAAAKKAAEAASRKKTLKEAAEKARREVEEAKAKKTAEEAAAKAMAKQAAAKAKREAKKKKSLDKKAARKAVETSEAAAKTTEVETDAQEGKTESQSSVDEMAINRSFTGETSLSEQSLMITVLNGLSVPVGSDPPTNISLSPSRGELPPRVPISSPRFKPEDLQQQRTNLKSKQKRSPARARKTQTTPVPFRLVRSGSAPPLGTSLPELTDSVSQKNARGSQMQEAMPQIPACLEPKVAKHEVEKDADVTDSSKPREDRFTKPSNSSEERTLPLNQTQQLQREILLKALEFKERRLEDISREAKLLEGKPDLDFRPSSRIAGRDFSTTPSPFDSTRASFVTGATRTDDESTISTHRNDMNSAMIKTAVDLGAIGTLVTEETLHMLEEGANPSDDETSYLNKSTMLDPTAVLSDIANAFTSKVGTEQNAAETECKSNSTAIKTKAVKKSRTIDISRVSKKSQTTSDDMSMSAALGRTTRSLQFFTGPSYPGSDLFGDDDSLAAKSGCSSRVPAKPRRKVEIIDTFDEDSLVMAWDVPGPTEMKKARTDGSTPLNIAETVASQIVSVFSPNAYTDYDDAATDASSATGFRSDYFSGEESSYDSRSFVSSTSLARRLKHLRETRRGENGGISPVVMSPPRMSQVDRDSVEVATPPRMSQVDHEISRKGSNASNSMRLTRTFSSAMGEEKKDDLSQLSSAKPDPVHCPKGDRVNSDVSESNKRDETESIAGIAQSFSQEIVLTVSSDKAGDSLYSRSIKVDSSDPKKSEEVIAQEIVCALSEGNSGCLTSHDERRILKAEFVTNPGECGENASTSGDSTRGDETLDETLDETMDETRHDDDTCTSASRTMSESAFNDTSLLVEIDNQESIGASVCHPFAALFCNAF